MVKVRRRSGDAGAAGAQDEDHEQVLGRVAAVDVAKASGMVCTRVPHESKVGRRVTKVWQVDATTNAIIEGVRDALWVLKLTGTRP